MDKQTFKIAVASSDGIVVNNHFGKAKQFYIYQVKDDKQQFIEIRTMTPVCTNSSHEDKKLMENLQKLSDCGYLLVSRIGTIAANAAESIGIESYEIPGMIEESIEQLIKYIKIHQLFQ